MKGTYVFEQGLDFRQTMILDDLKLYIPKGNQFEVATFEDEKEAAQGFNRIMMARFSPKQGWRIAKKQMGVAVAPPAEQMVGYTPPPSETPQPVDITKTPVHVAGDHLMINVERVEVAELAGALTAHRETVKHLCLYARHKASAGLAGLMKNPWPGLESLVIDAFDQTVTRQATCRVGDLSALLPAVPDLKRLYVGGQLGFSKPIQHKALTHISLLGNPIPASSLEVFASCVFTNLHRLDLAVSTEALPEEGWIGAMVLRLNKAQPLDLLHLEGAFESSEVLEALAPVSTRMPRELHVIGSVRDEDTFVAAAKGLAKGRLKALVVPEGELVDDSISALAKMFDTVNEGAAAFLPTAYGLEAYQRV